MEQQKPRSQQLQHGQAIRYMPTAPGDTVHSQGAANHAADTNLVQSKASATAAQEEDHPGPSKHRHTHATARLCIAAYGKHTHLHAGAPATTHAATHAHVQPPGCAHTTTSQPQAAAYSTLQ
jgi:hypothetical protein